MKLDSLPIDFYIEAIFFSFQKYLISFWTLIYA